MTTTVERKTDYVLNWSPSPPDPRDHIYGVTHDPIGLVREHYIANSVMPPVYDQLQLGSCTGNGVAGIVQQRRMAQGKATVNDVPSRLYIYYHERAYEGTINEDAGAYVRDGLKVVSKLGVPPETEWPYDINKFAETPPAVAEADAAAYKALRYARVVPGVGAPMRAALAKGYGVVFGFTVPAEFEDLSANQPLLHYPDHRTQYIGGHCVWAFGYDWTLKRFNVPVVWCRNSWSDSWGEAGNFAMDARFFNNPQLTDDFWVIYQES